MAAFAAINARVIVGGWDVSGNSNNVQAFVSEKAELPVTNWASAGWQEFIAGLGQSQIDVEGFNDFTAGQEDQQFGLGFNFGVPDIPISVSPLGFNDGDVTYFMRTLETKYEIYGKVGDVSPFKVHARAENCPLIRGLALHPLYAAGANVARTVTGTGTITLLGAVPAGSRVWAVSHVIAASGTTPSLTCVVQSAALVGFGSPTARITLGAQTAPGFQFGSALGPITDQYWRVSYTISGTTPSFQFGVAVGFAPA